MFTTLLHDIKTYWRWLFGSRRYLVYEEERALDPRDKIRVARIVSENHYSYTIRASHKGTEVGDHPNFKRSRFWSMWKNDSKIITIASAA